jgi:hypothetical protein
VKFAIAPKASFIWMIIPAILGAGCSHKSLSPPNGVAPMDKTEPTAPAVAPSPELPATLKNDAYSYYGLAAKSPKTYQLIVSNSPTNSTQTVTISLESVKDGKAQFSETDSGSVLGESTQQMSLQVDGLFVESISPQTLKTPHFLQLPSKLTPNESWVSHQAVVDKGQEVDETLTFKVLGTRSITTPAGKFDALDIIGTGKGTLASKPTTLSEESWYVKDFGMVKQVAKIVTGGQTTTITQTLQK